MVHSCSAYNCKQRFTKDSGISFHRFPTNPEMRNKWIIAIKRDNYNPSKTAVLCSTHFKETDFVIYQGRRRLCSHAIPSVFDFPKHVRAEASELTRSWIESKNIVTNKSLEPPAGPLPDTLPEEPLNTTPKSSSTPPSTSINILQRFCGKRRSPTRLGDFKEMDFDNPKKMKLMYNIAKIKINTKNEIIKKLRIQNKRLNNDVHILRSIMDHLKKTNKVSGAYIQQLKRVMVISCSAKNCSSRHSRGGGISFHKFPVDPEMRQKWINATSRDNFNPSKYAVLCSKHFKPEDYISCFGVTKLRQGVVPTIFECSTEEDYEPVSLQPVCDPIEQLVEIDEVPQSTKNSDLESVNQNSSQLEKQLPLPVEMVLCPEKILEFRKRIRSRIGIQQTIKQENDPSVSSSSAEVVSCLRDHKKFHTVDVRKTDVKFIKEENDLPSSSSLPENVSFAPEFVSCSNIKEEKFDEVEVAPESHSNVPSATADKNLFVSRKVSSCLGKRKNISLRNLDDDGEDVNKHKKVDIPDSQIKVKEEKDDSS